MTTQDGHAVRELLLSRPVLWHTEHGSQFYWCSLPTGERRFSEDDLALIDLRLVVALDYLLPRNTPNIAGELVYLTLHSWYDTEPAWTDFNGVLYYHARIDAIVAHDVGRQTVKLATLAYAARQVVGINVITGKLHNHRQTCSYAWLEDKFPGSVNRLQTGETLGLEQAELTQYVFFPAKATVGVVLPDDLSM